MISPLPASYFTCWIESTVTPVVVAGGLVVLGAHRALGQIRTGSGGDTEVEQAHMQSAFREYAAAGALISGREAEHRGQGVAQGVTDRVDQRVRQDGRGDQWDQIDWARERRRQIEGHSGGDQAAEELDRHRGIDQGRAPIENGAARVARCPRRGPIEVDLQVAHDRTECSANTGEAGDVESDPADGIAA